MNRHHQLVINLLLASLCIKKVVQVGQCRVATLMAIAESRGNHTVVIRDVTDIEIHRPSGRSRFTSAIKINRKHKVQRLLINCCTAVNIGPQHL